MNIQQLQSLIKEFRDERDRKQFHNPKDLASAVSIEAWELMEHFLWKSQEKSHEIAKKQDVIDEFADVMNYLLLFADVCDIDIAKAVQEKLEKNKIKYPVDKAKWNSDKYTQL